MNNTYNNVPTSTVDVNSTIQAFDTYFSKPLELDATVYSSIKAFFTSRGFEETGAESITVIIMKQAKVDGYNPMAILDTLRGMDNVEISALVSEIVNYNRFKTSYLGYALAFQPNPQIVRNIQA
jgi:hypothetical protein